jgi:putative glycosyltransferase (TIGR04372 family)
MSYQEAALFLAKAGYYVIRMGKWVSSTFDVSHPNIIDYANHTLRCDFLDIYLSSKCEFFMSTSSGVDAVAQVFRHPLLLTNVSFPSELRFYAKNCLFIPKKLKFKNSAQFLTFHKIHELTFSHEREISTILKNETLEVVNNTGDEIIDVVQEMIKRIECTWLETEIDCKLQNQFFKNYCIQYVKNLDDVKIKVGNVFLKKNSELFL